MEDYRQRVIDEKAELDERIERLGAFRGTAIHDALSSYEQGFLTVDH